MCSQGGLKPGLVIELANNTMAMVLAVDDQGVRIDANNMMAGKKLFFELEVIAINQIPPEYLPAMSSAAKEQKIQLNIE